MNRAQYAFWFLVALLLSLGFGIAAARHYQLEIPFFPGEQRPIWLVEARVDFVATGDPLRVNLALPGDPPGFRLFTEQAASPGYGFAVLDLGGTRRGEWTKREGSGSQTLYFTAQFISDPDHQPTRVEGDPRPREVFFAGASATAASQLLGAAMARSSTPESLARELIRQLERSDVDQNAALLRAGELDRAALLERLLNQAGVAARLAYALELEDARRRRSLTPMVEIPVDGRWLLFHPVTGRQGMGENLLLWQQGGASLLDVNGGSQSQVTFSMLRQTVPALDLAHARFGDSMLASFGVSGLPIEEQGMFKLLFLLPLGALVVSFMRIVVGIRTAGTFMPVLIAMAFLQTSLGLGLVSFLGVVGLGLVLRSYLSYLNLLLVARISTLIVIVILMISLLSLAGYRLGYSTGMTITFFPMIIIAWTIERMSILWEEEGPWEVLMQGGGSMVVAVLAYLLMELRLVQHLTFNFPELNLVLLAGILVIGQYTGYRLTELYRFRDMVGTVR